MEYPGRVVKLGEADASVVQAVRGQFNRMMAGESNLDPQGTAFDADMKRVVKLFQARHVVPWCCAFVYYCFDKASKKLGRPKNPMVRTAGCLDHWNKAPSRGAARIRAAEATDDPRCEQDARRRRRLPSDPQGRGDQQGLHRLHVSRLRGGRRGHQALFGTAMASFCTVLAMLRLVLRAFVAASLADLGAQLQDGAGASAAARHRCSGQLADGGAIDVQRDAPGHHLHVILGQARRGAVVARRRTIVAGSDALGVFLM
jgi:hypothetical protein